MLRRLLPIAPLCLGTFLIACPGPEPTNLTSEPRAITIEGILADANQNIRTHLVGVANTGEAFEGVTLLGELVGTSTNSEPCVEGECPEQVDPVVAANEAADTIAAEVLNASRVESSSDTQVTLRFGEELCPNDESGTPDAECIDAVGRLQPRLVLQSYTEGDVDARLTLGEARSAVASFLLHRARLATELDLAVAKTIALDLAPTLGEDNQAFIDALQQATVQGRIRVELTALGAAAYRMTLGISSALLIEADLDGAPLHLAMAAAPQLISIEADPATPRLDVTLASGGAELAAPLAMFVGYDAPVCSPDDPNCEPEPAPEVEGTLQLTTPAAGARLHIGAAQEILLENIHMDGALQARLDNQALATFELGAVSGGAFGLTVSPVEGATRVAVSPSADAVMDLSLGALVAQGLEIPSFMVNERMELKLDGTSGSPTVDVRDDGQLQVIAGRLTIASRAANKTLVVNAGQCLVGPEDEPVEEPQHPLDVLEAGVCR